MLRVSLGEIFGDSSDLAELRADRLDDSKKNPLRQTGSTIGFALSSLNKVE